MKKGKRILAAFLAVLMVVAIMPFTSFSGIFTSKAKAAENNTYKFDAKELTAAADKEALTGKVANDYATVFGSVTKRTSSDGSVSSTELAKDAKAGYEFTVTGVATVNVVISSTGGSNTSKFALTDANGTAVADKNGETEISVTGSASAKKTVSYELTAGTYRMVSAAGFTERGVRVYAFDITESTNGEKPARPAWSEVAAPVIGEIKVDNNKITVPYTMVVGNDGADQIVISMKDSNGKVLKSETISSSGTE